MFEFLGNFLEQIYSNYYNCLKVFIWIQKKIAVCLLAKWLVRSWWGGKGWKITWTFHWFLNGITHAHTNKKRKKQSLPVEDIRGVQKKLVVLLRMEWIRVLVLFLRLGRGRVHKDFVELVQTLFCGFFFVQQAERVADSLMLSSLGVGKMGRENGGRAKEEQNFDVENGRDSLWAGMDWEVKGQ